MTPKIRSTQHLLLAPIYAIALNCSAQSQAFIATPNQSQIEVWIRTPTRTALSIAQTDQSYIDHYKSLGIPISQQQPGNELYNCHNFAWHLTPNSLGPSSGAWLERCLSTTPCPGSQFFPDNIKKYWEDGSWTNVTSACNGCNVYFDTKDHTAVWTGAANNPMRSKWGEQGVFNHNFDNCPYGWPSGAWKFYQKAVGGSLFSAKVDRNFKTASWELEKEVSNVKGFNIVAYSLGAEGVSTTLLNKELIPYNCLLNIEKYGDKYSFELGDIAKDKNIDFAVEVVYWNNKTEIIYIY